MAATAIVYDAIPATLPFSMASLGFQATQTAEFGDYIHLAGTYRGLSSVTVTMVTWAYHAEYPSMSVAGWTHPFTLTIYNVVPGAPLNTRGAVLATTTQTLTVPWRPDPDPTCGSPTQWRASDSLCYNGYAFNLTFDLSSLNETLPNDIIVGIAYNTQTWGSAPLGVGGPYNSLNVGAVGTPTVGTDGNTDRVFWNTATAAWYTDGGTGGVGIFREDTNWSPYGTIPIEIVAKDEVYPTTLASVPPDGATLTSGPTQLTFTFSEDVLHDGSSVAADNVINYLLFEDGSDDIFNTEDCAGNVSSMDAGLLINSAVYDPATFTVTLNINNGIALSPGTYRLLVCGTTSIEDADGYELNDGTADSQVEFTVIAAPASTAVLLPRTGFAPGRVTVLPEQSASYAETDLWLEIPRLGVQMDIVGVPQANGEWDVTWLGQNAGWLEGSAFPTWEGNSVITGHVWNADNTAGPFRAINTLWYGDQIIVHAWGAEYVYSVRSVLQVGPGSTAQMLKHEELPWVTLVTCRGYDPATDSYRYRVLVRAVLVEVR